MKANDWRKFLAQQRASHGKVLYSVTELANVAGACGAALNVELTRLREQEIIVKYAHGLYGPPGTVSLEALVAAVDSRAYITGHYALHAHGLATQTSVVVTCFTDRRTSKACERVTPLGRLVLTCARTRAYCQPAGGAIAPPAQALCDYVYLSRRQGTAPESLLTFRNLARVRDADFIGILGRYPLSVREHVERLLRVEQ